MIGVLAIGLTLGCAQGAPSRATRLAEAQRLASDLRLQFQRAAAASNSAVRADTDDASVAFARDAQAAKTLAASDTSALSDALRGLELEPEVKILWEFEERYREYDTLDRTVLELAVENTNLKAQKLSFGPASEGADQFRNELDALASASPAKSRAHVLTDRCEDRLTALFAALDTHGSKATR